MSRRTRSCERKTAYRSWEAAEAARRRCVDTGFVPAGKLHVYPCQFGDHFHLGHVSKRIRQQATRRAS
jgi:hypothetical protein